MKRLFRHYVTTSGVTVMGTVNFLPEQSSPIARRWFWAYYARIENETDEPLRLEKRHLRTTDCNGLISHITTDGVAGEQPLIDPGRSYDYVSGCPLRTASGSMDGHFLFSRPDGNVLKAAIPIMTLVAAVIVA